MEKKLSPLNRMPYHLELGSDGHSFKGNSCKILKKIHTTNLLAPMAVFFGFSVIHLQISFMNHEISVRIIMHTFIQRKYNLIS